MASVIKIKRSSTTGAVPASLQVGEIAVNLFDRKLYVGNTTGVTAIGGEDFRLTTQTAGEGAYLKLNGDSVLSTNTVLVRGGTGVSVARDANGSVSISSTLGSDISSKATWTALTSTNTAIRALVSDRLQVANAAATYQTISTSKSYLANTNAYIAAQLANTNAYIAATAATERSSLANTNAYIATKLNSSAYTTADVRSKAALANTNAYIASVQATERSALANTNARIAATETNISQKLGAGATVQLTGDVTGSATFSSNSVSITTTIAADSVALGTDTTGNYVAGISGTTNEITVSGSGSEGASVTIGLPDNVTVGNNLTVSGNTSVAGNMTIDGNLTVEGGVTYISSSTVNVDDTMLKLSANNAADTVDHGVYAKYVDGVTTKYAGYFRDSSDSSIFKFYKGLTVEPTTTVNTGGAGYALAQVDAVIDGGTY